MVSGNQGESSQRSLLKAVSWRVVAFIVLSIVTYTFTGSIKETGAIALVYNLVQIGVYFGHERLWDRVTWGKPAPVEQLPRAGDLTPGELDAITTHLRELGYIE